MSLAFLAKKTWHTSNLKNVEKVWIAEQKKKAQDARLKEIKKQIEEEKQVAELRELQAQHGNKSALVQKVDWMYDGPMAGTETSAEEYLLGKAVDGNAVDEEIGQLQSGAAAGSLFLKKETKANEAFTRLHEDPMLTIRKQQMEARKKVTANPRKMQKLEAMVAAEKERKREKKAAKKEKKKEKKAEKKMAKKMRKEDKKRAKAGEPPRELRASSPADRGSDRDRDRDDRRNDRSRAGERGRDADRRERDYDRGRGRGRDRDRDRDRDHGRDVGRDGEQKGGREREEREREERQKREREREEERERFGPPRGKAPLKAGYGLQHGKYDTEKKGDYLGPDPAMLAKRRKFVADTEAAEQEAKAAVSGGRKRPRTAAEREEAILAMQRDAEVNDMLRDSRMKRQRQVAQAIEEERDVADNTGVNPKFLTKMGKQSFVDNEGQGAMAKRLSETKHYQQRNKESLADE